MQTYNFTAINQKGHKVSGEFDARDENDLDESLKRMGLALSSFHEASEVRRSFSGKAKLADIAMLCTEMSIALRAQIPLVESLEIVGRNAASPALHNAIEGIRVLISQGMSLADAFECYPKLFDNFFITLVGIGERSGRLSDIFTALEAYTKWMIALRKRFIKVVRYPLISASFTTGVIWMFFIHIVCFFLYHTYALPDTLIKVLPFSNLVIFYWPFILFGPLVLIYSTLLLYRNSEAVAYQIDWIFLRLPILGEVLTKLNTARFVYFFASMFNAGFSIEQSLLDAEKVVKNRALRHSFSLVSAYIKKGHGLGESVALARVFPPMVAQAFRLGEETGDIGRALEKVNSMYRQQADDSIDAFADYLRYFLLILSGIFLAT